MHWGWTNEAPLVRGCLAVGQFVIAAATLMHHALRCTHPPPPPPPNPNPIHTHTNTPASFSCLVTRYPTHLQWASS